MYLSYWPTSCEEDTRKAALWSVALRWALKAVNLLLGRSSGWCHLVDLRAVLDRLRVWYQLGWLGSGGPTLLGFLSLGQPGEGLHFWCHCTNCIKISPFFQSNVYSLWSSFFTLSLISVVRRVNAGPDTWGKVALPLLCTLKHICTAFPSSFAVRFLCWRDSQSGEFLASFCQCRCWQRPVTSIFWHLVLLLTCSCAFPGYKTWPV